MKIETTIQEAISPGKSGWRIELGKAGEAKAVEYLKRSGWAVLERNWRCGRFGEIDLIARNSEGLLVFCEIKTRFLTKLEAGIRNEGFESVHWKKQRKIVICAMNYMRYFKNAERSCRFDVLAIEFRVPDQPLVGKEVELVKEVDVEKVKEVKEVKVIRELKAVSGKTVRSLSQLETLTPIIRHVEGAFS